MSGILFFVCGPLFSQGNNCNQAAALGNLSNFCSTASQYTNSGATASGVAPPSCWTGSPMEDVWFSFVAIGTEVLVAVNGSTIVQPRIALYTGSCTSLTPVAGACSNGTPGFQDAQLFTGGLVQGNTYYIRVSSIQQQEGSFQLCINNFTPPASATPDCNGAGILCNKDPLSVSGLNGGGANINETAGTCLDAGFGFPETNSIWYTWTCATAGTLLFDLFPANQMDDIDFALFQLNTTDPCGPRTLIRCNAASCTNTLASTGLNLTSFDITEPAGCFGTADAYVQFVNMTAGTSYALLINNFTAATGFTLTWGGTGTFVGPAANITGAPFTICAGDTVSLDGSTSTNYSALNWNFTNGSGTPPAATGPGPIAVTYPAPGTYTAILNAMGATGCTSVETAVITVNAVVTPTFNLPPTLCQNTSPPALPATSVNGISGTWSPAAISTTTPGTTTYTFTPGGSSCATSTAVTITVNPVVVLAFPTVPAFCEGTAAPLFPVQTNNPVITGTWSPGIISTNLSGTYMFTPDPGECADSLSIFITVNPLPVVSVSSNSPLCPGDQLDLSGNTVPGGVYDWDGPANFDSNLEDPSIPGITPAGAGTYTLHLTDPNGCSDEASTTVVINAPVTPVLTPAGPFCAEDQTPVNLTASIPNGTWTGPGVTDPAGVFIPSVAGAGTHTLTYTHTQGCGGTQTMDVVVTAIPVADFVADTLSGCSPLVVQFTSDPDVTASSWNFGDGSTANTVGGAIHTYTSPGSYTVTLTNTVNGCTSTTTVPDYILVFPDVFASFIASSTVLSQYNTEVQFYNNSENATSYVWEFGDGLSSILEDPAHQYPLTPASYTVTLTASNAAGCEDVTTLVIVVEEDQLIYVPNTFTPDGDEHNNVFLPVLSEGFDVTDYELLLFDRWGEIVFESRDTEVGWDGTYHGQLVPEGAYTWTIRVKHKSNDKRSVYNGHVLLIK